VIAGNDGRIKGVEYRTYDYRTYDDPASAASRPYRAEADVVVVAAHSIENARLLLALGLARDSGELGRNLMDHPTMLTWALSPAGGGQIGPFRGPGSTEEHTDHSPRDGVAPLGYFRYRGHDYAYKGAGHGAGTHIMGADSKSSVVDSFQRCWDHRNRYAVGCGSMPSIGTSNPSLTMAALALRSAEQIHRWFRAGAPAPRTRTPNRCRRPGRPCCHRCVPAAASARSTRAGSPRTSASPPAAHPAPRDRHAADQPG